ncbi:MAG TPA: fumarylacetoacetase [Bryobacteraceae bacterium]|nr:fumarylacetoacetase [Bryobacteraceae bacterium]
MPVDETHDPALESWVDSANDPASDFPIQNLPYCRFRDESTGGPRAGVRIGDQILDITAAFSIGSAESIMAMPRAARIDLRRRASALLARNARPAPELLRPAGEAELLLPCAIGDYTDFFASLDHATNVGCLFRPGNPLQPNYKWLPVAYHGRASSIVLSGTTIRRPRGQIANRREGPPVFAPTRRLDYEMELGAFIGPGNPMGTAIPVREAADHVVGVCLLNDWSARDIQTWEYQPLGPFLAKSFATSISPWVVTLEALEPFRTEPRPRAASDPPPLPYLRNPGKDAFAITVEVWLRSPGMREPMLVSRGNFGSMYWTFAQMVAHHTSNGCPLRAGDLIGSGTISGPEKQNRGCLLEMTRGGAEPLRLPSGETRTFLEDGDEVILRGYCEAPGFRRIGLGECRGTVGHT